MDAANHLTLRFASDAVEAVLLPERGARLHRLRAFGHDLLRTPGTLDAYEREPFFWGGFVMAPWCNRVDARPTRIAGHLVDLASNFPDGTAIHGQVQALPWTVTADGTLRVEAGGDGWPWPYEVTLEARVDGLRLLLNHAITNLSEVPMPAGIGIHPWFRTPLEVAFPADAVYGSNEASQPQPRPVEGPLDLRRLQPMPAGIDGTWVRRGDETITLRWPDIGVSAALRAGPVAGYLCAASPAGFGAVAVEPQTHAPNALRRLGGGEDGGLQWLSPGGTLLLEVTLDFSRDG